MPRRPENFANSKGKPNLVVAYTGNRFQDIRYQGKSFDKIPKVPVFAAANSEGCSMNPNPPSAEQISKEVCQKIHQLRQDRGWSLDTLSGRSGVSRSMLSQIERQQANPTLAITVKIANAFGISIAELIQQIDPPPKIRVLPGNLPAHIYRSDDQCSLRTLSPSEQERGVEFYELVISPGGCLDSAAHINGTCELLTVQKGKIRVHSGGENAELGKGDSASYNADVLHKISNIGSSQAICYLVVVYQS